MSSKDEAPTQTTHTGAIATLTAVIGAPQVLQDEVYHPAQQPWGEKKFMAMTFDERSAVLNNYLTKNTMQIISSDPITTGFLTIKLAKPSTRGIYIVFQGSNNGKGIEVSGRLTQDKQLSHLNDEYVYSLNEISLVQWKQNKVSTYDWASDNLSQPNKIHYVGAYIETFDGNTIESITVSHE